MVEQSSEPFLLSFLCCHPHTCPPPGHSPPVLCRVHVRLNDVLLRLCPSLPNLRRRSPSFVRLAHRYYGTVRLLQHVHVRIAACGLRGPALIVRPGVLEISRFSCMLSLSVRGFLDYAGPSNPLAIAWLLCCLPPTRNEVGILIYGLFAAQSPRPPMPLSTLQAAPRRVACKTRGQHGFATHFPVVLLHPLLHARLSLPTLCRLSLS